MQFTSNSGALCSISQQGSFSFVRCGIVSPSPNPPNLEEHTLPAVRLLKYNVFHVQCFLLEKLYTLSLKINRKVLPCNRLNTLNNNAYEPLVYLIAVAASIRISLD